MSMDGMSDENLRQAAQHAQLIGDTGDTAQRIERERVRRQDKAVLTREAYDRKYGTAAPATPAAAPKPDGITRHVLAPISIDIFETGAGQISTHPNDGSEGPVYDVYRDGGQWHAEDYDDRSVRFSARSVADLARRVADHHGITGTVSIEDERESGKSITQRFEHTPAPAPAGPKRGSIEAKIEAKQKEIERRVGAVSLAREARSNTGARIQSGRESKANAALSQARRELAALQEEQRQAIPADLAGGAGASRNADGTITVGGLRTDQRWVTSAGLPVSNPSQNDIIQGRVKLVTRPVQAAPAGVGPGTVPLGGTDADRRAARPRLEINGRPESDRAYEVRTAPTREAALSILNGNQVGGLRAIARAEGVVTSGSKADLVARLIRVMRDRHADSEAITAMVNRDRPAPVSAQRTTAQVDEAELNWLRSMTEPFLASVTSPARFNRLRAAGLIEATGGTYRGEPLYRAVTGVPQPTMTGSQLLAARRAQRGG